MRCALAAAANHRVGPRRRHPDQGQPHPLAGGVVEAVNRMKAARQEMPIEVEAQSLAEVDGAIEAGADIILLDNLSIEDIHQAVGAHRGPRQDRDLRRRDARAHATSSHARAPTTCRSAR